MKISSTWLRTSSGWQHVAVQRVLFWPTCNRDAKYVRSRNWSGEHAVAVIYNPLELIKTHLSATQQKQVHTKLPPHQFPPKNKIKPD